MIAGKILKTTCNVTLTTPIFEVVTVG